MRGKTLDEYAVAAATRRFPQTELSIRRLMNSSEDFCDMCAELAEAELALANAEELAAELRAARRAEWQDMVDRLVCEIATALSKSEEWTIPRNR